MTGTSRDLIIELDKLFKGHFPNFRKDYMSYEVYTDGIFGGIRMSRDTPDNFSVFRTFTEARTALAKIMDGRALEYRMAARSVRSMTKADVEPCKENT